MIATSSKIAPRSLAYYQRNRVVSGDMTKGRVEAFSDAVIAIIITVMVLDLKVPHGQDLGALRPMLPTFGAYVLSFAHVGIYWNNHHHMLAVAERVNGRVLWANLHLLFWLSLMPIATAWMGESRLAPVPTALYGLVLLLSGFAYYILGQVLVASHERHSRIALAVGSDRKGKISNAMYLAGVLLSVFAPSVGAGVYVLVALLWLIPDSRIESVTANSA